MREDDYRDWLVEQGLSDITTPISANRRIERDENVNLDKQFDKDRLAWLLERYTYTTQDERDGRPNPTSMEAETVSLVNFLSAYKSALNQYRKFRLSEHQIPADAEQETNTDADRKTIIALEKHLQAAFRENISQLDPHLKIIDNGKERRVASGKIDVLAKDNKGRFVIIELKAGTAIGDVIGQTLGYMGDIAREENQTKENIRGIIVAGDFNQRVRSAASFNPEIELISYSYLFAFKKETPEPIK